MKQTVPTTIAEFDETRITERPDGIYWQSQDGGKEYGPFPTLMEAVQDMQSGDDDAVEPGETLEEAESEIGMASWVDPETGLPAEESVPRLEEH